MDLSRTTTGGPDCCSMGCSESVSKRDGRGASCSCQAWQPGVGLSGARVCPERLEPVSHRASDGEGRCRCRAPWDWRWAGDPATRGRKSRRLGGGEMTDCQGVGGWLINAARCVGQGPWRAVHGLWRWAAGRSGPGGTCEARGVWAGEGRLGFHLREGGRVASLAWWARDGGRSRPGQGSSPHSADLTFALRGCLAAATRGARRAASLCLLASDGDRSGRASRGPESHRVGGVWA